MCKDSNDSVAREPNLSALVAGQLAGGVAALFATAEAFIALKADGSVVAWGAAGYGPLDADD